MQNLNDLFKSIFSGIQSSIKRINSKIKKLDTDIKNIDIPTKLPNPKALTLTGAVSASYDGSHGVSVWIPDASGKMDKNNPTGTGSFSLNRKAGTVVGANSHAEGSGATASGWYSHAEGRDTTASNDCSHAEGQGTSASGTGSHTEGYYTKASSSYQHAQGKYNIEDSSNVYADIIGNGTKSKPSNAATVDWSGNAWYAGDVYVGSTSGKYKDEGSKRLATEEYVNNSIPSSIEIPTTLPNPNPLTFTGAVEGTYDGSNPLTVEIPSGDSIVPAPSSADNGKYLGCENGAAKWLPVDAAGGGDISLGLTSASVGQTIKVKAVDENGKPTEWETAKEKTLKWITIHSSTLTEEATSFSVSADENGKAITDYNPLGIAVALYVPADSTQADTNGQVWVYPQSKIGDNVIRIISTISGWKTISRDAMWMWQGGDILGFVGANNGALPTYRLGNYVMDGVCLLVFGKGNHLPVGTKAIVTILCEM